MCTFAVVVLVLPITLGRAQGASAPSALLSPAQSAQLSAALQAMQNARLKAEATLGAKLLAQGVWRAALPNDAYIAQAEKDGDTPFAYTLSPGKKPTAIVLAARFFTGATKLGEAAVMIHEMGHYSAYVKSGKSDEYDGYKAEYDDSARLGLTEKDGLVYFSMLDGVAEYVVPRNKTYASKPGVSQFVN